MALNDPYATTAELKSRLGITDSTDDTRIGEALAAASRGIEDFTGRQFNKTTTASARVYYPDHGCLTRVHDFHTTIDLAVATDEGDDGTYETTWATTDYQLEPLNGIEDGQTSRPYRRIRAVESRYFPTRSRRAPVQVTAQWGWNAVPAPVKEACLISAEEVFGLKDARYGVANFGEFGAIRVRENPRTARMLAPYRLYAVLVG